MKTFFLLFPLLVAQIVSAQDTAWNKVTIDSNLTVELPGPAEKAGQSNIDKYIFEIFSCKIDSAGFVIMKGISKEKIEINNKEDYKNAMDELLRGALTTAWENNWNVFSGDTTCDGVSGKKMHYTGKLSGQAISGYNYFFLVNGVSYHASVIFRKIALTQKDSVCMSRFLSSLNFNDNIREKQFETRLAAVAYRSGKLTVMLIVAGIIIAVVIFVVRNL